MVQVLARERIGAVVVEDPKGRLAGIFSERDLVNLLARFGTTALTQPVQGVMTTPVLTCGADDRIDAVLGRMTRNRIRHMPVLESGALAGLISIGDLVHHRLDEKELEADVLLDITRMRA